MFFREGLGGLNSNHALTYSLITKLLVIKLPTPKREWAIQLFLFLFLEQLILTFLKW
jgi:hypothetical protein